MATDIADGKEEEVVSKGDEKVDVKQEVGELEGGEEESKEEKGEEPNARTVMEQEALVRCNTGGSRFNKKVSIKARGIKRKESDENKENDKDEYSNEEYDRKRRK